MALNTVRIELRAEQIVAELRSEARAAIPCETGGGDAGELRHRRHEVAGEFEFGDRLMPLAVNAAVQEVHERVALAVLRVHEVSHGADHLAGGRPHDFDGIIKATAREGLKLRAVRAQAPDARGEALQVGSLLRLDVEPVPTIGEIQPAIRPEERPMQARRAAHVPTAQQHRPRVRQPVPIHVIEAQQLRR